MKQQVMVTTEHKGVFAGTLEKYDDKKKQAVLTNARMCVYWSADIRGVLGLAASGPSASCRISPAAKRLTLEGVTSISELTAEAAKKWETAPWK